MKALSLNVFRSLLLSFLLILAFSIRAQDRLAGKYFSTRSVIYARHGMVCSSSPLAVQAGIDVLKKGGSAIDAAIAANAVIGLTDPEMNGVGGDLFAIVYDAKTKKLYGLNASGHSPYGLTLDDFQKKGLKSVPSTGILSISVPGCVDGWFSLHKRFGKRTMAENLSYAIQYAKEGFPLEEEASFFWPDLFKETDLSSNAGKTYGSIGMHPVPGTIFRNPDLAATLEKIAKGGRDAFYKGDIARRIENFMKANGGYLSMRDFADHSSTWVDPVSTSYRGYRVFELPPNGQGITVLQMLNILEAYDFSKIPFESAERIHLLTEAKRLAYEDRARFYGDPEFNKIPVDKLISKEYAAERRKLIRPDRATREISSGDSILKGGETIYLTAADEEGNFISLIQSNSSNWGSGLVADGLGFILQNRGASFNLEKGNNNEYAPHKRPFHTIIPSFVTKNDTPFMSFGVMGGGFQPQGHVQILTDVIDYGMTIQEAGDAPRVQHSGSSEPNGSMAKGTGVIELETGYSFETVRKLMDMGYKVQYGTPGTFGGYQCIQFDAKQKVLRGASESRKDGMAAGY